MKVNMRTCSREAAIEGKEEGNANGLCLGDGNTVHLRVDGREFLVTLK
jgi:hypothetical protein